MPSLPRNFASGTFDQLIVFSTKKNCYTCPIQWSRGVLSSASDKAKLFAENFSKNSNLDDSGISLPTFPSRTNLKLHNISVTVEMVKKS